MANELKDGQYRILSLDGGGSWALIEAATLGDIYGLKTPGREILNHFNLAIANSGGSLVLAGLILDMTPSDILDLLFDEQVRKNIFVKKLLQEYIFETISEKLSFRKYKTAKKYSGLARAFKDKPIDTPVDQIKTTFGIETDIVISAFDYDRERAKFFRSRSDSKTGPSAKGVTLLQAIHASSTAPVKFFDDPAEVKDGELRRFWDGGVGGFNNPVMAGVIETLGNDWDLRDRIRILSIGTGNNFLPLAKPGARKNPLYKPWRKSCLIEDITLVSQAIVADPPDAASFNAHVVLGGRLQPVPPAAKVPPDSLVGAMVRMNPLVQPRKLNEEEPWDYPLGISPYDFIRLTELQLDAVAREDVDIIRRFTKAWLEDRMTNQSILCNRNSLEHDIGHERYSHALGYWRTLDKQALDGQDWASNHQAVLDKLSL
jgi:hypothetical protein